MDETQKMSDEINFNNLTYYFASPNLAPINFIGFKGPLNFYNEIKNGETSVEKIEEDQEKFKSSLNEITSGNAKYRKNINQMQQKILKIFIIQEKKLSNYLMIMLKFDLKLCIKQTMEQHLKY